MKLYSPTDTGVHVALLSGHTTYITKEGTNVDKKFVSQALTLGCLTEPAGSYPIEDDDSDEAIAEAQPDTEQTEIERTNAITDAINVMLNGSEDGDFNADGRPNLKKLNAKLGFKASKEEVEVIFSSLI